MVFSAVFLVEFHATGLHLLEVVQHQQHTQQLEQERKYQLLASERSSAKKEDLAFFKKKGTKTNNSKVQLNYSAL